MAIVVTVLSLFAVRVSWAQELANEATGEYQRHWDNGIKLYKASDFEGARAEFEAAYRIEPKASPLINIALCDRERRKYPAAIRTLERALSDHAGTMDAANREALQRAIEEMRALLAFIAVQVEPAHARVTIDGEPLISEGHPVGPGVHSVKAVSDGFMEKTVSISVASQEKASVSLRLDPLLGKLKVIAAKASTVILIDQQKRGSWSWSGDLPVGPHTVELVGEIPARRVVIEAGKESSIDNRPSLRVPTKPDEPEPSGVYGMVTGALLVPFRHPVRFAGASVASGANAGLRGGYRFNTFAAFEGMVEYGNITNSIEVAGNAPDPEYSFTSWRFGPILRLMSPGDTVRFVGTLGGGLAIDLMSYANLKSCEPRCQDTHGVDFFITTDVGSELSIGGVLFGAALTFTVNGTKGSDDYGDEESKSLKQPYENRVLPMFGPRVHVGYAFW